MKKEQITATMKYQVSKNDQIESATGEPGSDDVKIESIEIHASDYDTTIEYYHILDLLKNQISAEQNRLIQLINSQLNSFVKPSHTQ